MGSKTPQTLVQNTYGFLRWSRTHLHQRTFFSHRGIIPICSRSAQETCKLRYWKALDSRSRPQLRHIARRSYVHIFRMGSETYRVHRQLICWRHLHFKAYLPGKISGLIGAGAGLSRTGVSLSTENVTCEQDPSCTKSPVRSFRVLDTRQTSIAWGEPVMQYEGKCQKAYGTRVGGCVKLAAYVYPASFS